MIGTTIDRDAIREDLNYQNYTYSPDRPVPSFDARISRDQDMYTHFASASVVTQAPRPRMTEQDQRAFAPDHSREELWAKLNSNPVPRSAIEKNMNFTPGVSAPFEPIKLREAQPRAQITRQHNAKKLSTQGKVILAVYLAVVLLIVTLVIVNAGLINTPDAEADAGAASVSQLYEVNEKGLSFAATPYNTPAEQSNWFDKLCDKLGD